MLKLYNKEHEVLSALTNLKDYKIEYVLSGEDLLEFSLSRYDENIPLIQEECYIRTEYNEYVIKAIEPSDNFKRFTCNINIESLVGKVIKNFDTKNNNINETIRLAIAGTGWTLADNSISKKRTVSLKNTNALEVLRKVRETFRVDFRFDAINKIIYVYEKLGSDKGVYFTDELNLISLDVPSDSYDYATRLYAKGKDGLTFADINNGKDYIENFQYSNKIIEKIWEDNRYTNKQNLKEDAEAKLEELSKPRRNYNVQVYDLAKNNSEFSFLDFSIGDTVTIISNLEKFKDKQRIVKYIEYPEDPSQNTCELGNTTLTFEELQKANEAKNQVVENITSDNGTVDGSKIDSITTEQISDFEAEVAKITDLTVVNAEITNLKAQNVTITGKLNAIEGEFGTLKANVGVIDKLTVTHTAQINDLKANSATITQLDAVSAKIGTVEADVGKINTLLAGNITGENIQAGGITSDKLTIANGFITNAMIANLDVSKVNAGDISTNKFRIKSDNGGIEIVGATQQFKDKNNRVRIQMGQDAKGNFNFIIRGEDGTTTLIDHTGIKEKAIADDLIKSEMISSDAVGEKQINYSSFITGFNKDTNTNTIKSTKIMLNNQNQTLDVAFSSLKTQADGTKSLTESHSTTIGVMQGQISTAINNTQIVKDGQTILLKDDYNRTVQTIDSMKSTIGSHTTQINGLDSKVSTQGSSISQLKTQIALKVEKSDITDAINDIQVSSENLFRYSDFSKENILSKWYRYTTTNHTLSVGVYSSFGNNLSEDAHIKNQKILRSRIDIDQAIKDGVDYGGFNIATNERGVTLEANTEYTFSYWVYKSGNCKSTHATIWTNVTEGSVSVGRTESVTKYTGSFVKQSVTFTTKDITDYYIRFYNYIDTSKVGGFSDVHIYQPLLTKGNKIVGWSPSAEDIEGFIADVDSKVTTVSSQVSQLNVSVGKINGEVSSLESTTKTISGKVDAAQKTADTATAKADSAQSTANTANSTANTNKGNISTLTTDMTSTKSKVSALEISMGNITTRVSDVETLSITNFNNLLINSNIKESVVGWRLTNLVEGTSLNRAITSANIPDRHCIYIGKLSDNTSQTRYMDSTKFVVTKGEKISISLHALNSAYVDRVNVYLLFTDNTKPIEEDNSFMDGYTSITITGKTWKRYTMTSTAPEGATRCFVRIRYTSLAKPSESDNNRTSLASIMVSRGDKYPTWTSNTEDSFQYHETRLKAAEQKITDDSITATVKKNFYTKTETDNQITSKGYQTESQVQQTVNDLEVKFSESGGYNLLYNGDFKRGIEKWNTTSGFTYTVGSGTWSSPDRKGVRITGKTGESGFLTQYITTSNLINGSKYTLSGYVYISSSGANDASGSNFQLYSRITYTDDTKEYFYTNINKALYDKWQKVSITFTRDVSKTVKEISASVSISKTTKYIYVSQIMLEQGTSTGSWSPNPNEVYDGITTIDKDGITVTSSNVKSKTSMSPDGFKITKTDTNRDVFKVNADGTLYFEGQVKITSGLDGTSTTGEGGRKVTIDKANYTVSENNQERAFLGFKNMGNGYDKYVVPKLAMGAFGYGLQHNYFTIIPYRGTDNPQGITNAYVDIAYHMISHDDYSNIKMYDGGDIRLAPVKNLEITTNYVDGKYVNADERRMAQFTTSGYEWLGVHLQTGGVSNHSNGYGLILSDRYRSDSWDGTQNGGGSKITSVRVHTDADGKKFFRPLNTSADIELGSGSYPWKSLSSKTTYSSTGIVANLEAKRMNDITIDNVLDNIEFPTDTVRTLDNEEGIIMDVTNLRGTKFVDTGEDFVYIDNNEMIKLLLKEVKYLKEEIQVLKGIN